jgi:hypothetical protein
MGATLRTGVIRKRRKIQEKRRKLRARLEHATMAERAALEAKLLKTYTLLTAEPKPKPRAAGRSGSGA